MYSFEDKKGRPICLIPEVTALVQEQFNNFWNREMKKPVRVFYEARCYRYEKPSKGRYREFTQFGVEILGEKDDKEIIDILKGCFEVMGIKDYIFNSLVKRGLDYYVEDGFEIEIAELGSQKQVAGGGRYKEGIGFAIGIDRILLVA